MSGIADNGSPARTALGGRPFRWAPVPGLVLLAVAGCMTMSAATTESGLDLEAVLRASPALEPVLEAAEEHRVQIAVGRVVEDESGQARLEQSTYRAGAEYFYPASTVKLVAAVAALQHLDELRQETGLAIDVDTPLIIHPLVDGDAIDDNDPDNLNGGTITVGQQIRELFLVSDNTAFNRLYDLVGQQRLNATAHDAGLDSARIVHRLSLARSAEENLRAPRVDLRGADFLYSLPVRRWSPQPEGGTLPGMMIGRAYLASDERVEEPMDFGPKNRITLADLQRGLCLVVRPDIDCGADAGGFDLRDEDRELLLEAMSRLPRQSTNPVYDSEAYPDHYVKFVLPGVRRVNDQVVVYDKSGQAYGFTTENAWIVDPATGDGFFLAATLYTNANATLNDDDYEYAEIAEPFMADLGEAIARHLWNQ